MTRLLCILALAAFAPAVRADLIFQAQLFSTNEVPPQNTLAFGFITLDLHTDLTTLDVTETFNDLTTLATAAHVHCCVPIGTNGPVALPFVGFPNTISGTYTHTFNLTTDLINGVTPATFITGLEGGNAYANIHDSIFPGGEIRGQLAEVPEPGTLSLLGSCLIGLALFRRRFA